MQQIDYVPTQRYKTGLRYIITHSKMYPINKFNFQTVLLALFTFYFISITTSIEHK